jgi:hypothetical protein
MMILQDKQTNMDNKKIILCVYETFADGDYFD